MSNTYHMSLNVPSFARIKDGSKTIELRLNDEKRQAIRIGDKVIFEPATGEKEAVETVVVALLRYPTFAALIDDLPVEWFGNPDKEALKKGVYEHYTPEQETSQGVVGIRIRKKERS